MIQRDFAPKAQRLKSVISRVDAVPELLNQGRINLKAEKVPPIYADIALEQMPGIIEFFEKTLPDYFKEVDDQEALNQLSESNYRCVEALRDYEQFLKSRILPQAKGQFALGKERFAKKLLFEEFVDQDLDSLLADGEKELARLQAEFKLWAGKIEKGGDPVEVFKRVSANYPAPNKLIGAVSGVLEEIRNYCVKKPIVTIPGEERAKVEETPPFNRALSFASMDTPGPFEKVAKEAYYYVTLPEPDWSAEKADEHMRSFCQGDLLNTSVHEAYPGHYVQFRWVNKAPGRVRKVLGCDSNAEGWAHYCEQMMIEEGFRNGDP
ncbi:MAG: DUF885 domain-containing protein, partial [Candidatus Obscuribacterales bacterium]|nr:DUF885 domain-containing protein [Candidatus Obscuribacterales bacterium]